MRENGFANEEASRCPWRWPSSSTYSQVLLMQRLQVSTDNALELNCGLDTAAAVGSMGMSTCGFIVHKRGRDLDRVYKQI